MDTNCLKDHYQDKSNAYDDICQVLAKHGFENLQGSVFFVGRKFDEINID